MTDETLARLRAAMATPRTEPVCACGHEMSAHVARIGLCESCPCTVLSAAPAAEAPQPDTAADYPLLRDRLPWAFTDDELPPF